MSVEVDRIIEELLDAMGYKASVSSAEVGGQTIYSIVGVPNPRDLIGMHGDTIHAIDLLVKKIVEQRAGSEVRKEQSEGQLVPNKIGGSAPSRVEGLFLVDIDEYRTRHIKDLQSKAKMMAERARSFQYDVELSPMTAYERLIVHTALQSEPNVVTESQGEGRSRRVVIKYSAEA